MKKSTALARSLFVLFCASFFAASVPAQVSVYTRHYNNARTAANLAETSLTVQNVGGGTFGKLFTRDVDGEIYAQPLLVSGLSMPGFGTRNVLFVTTAHNSVYAYDADTPNSKIAPYWKVSLGASLPSGTIPTRNLPVEIGTISTPVIDPATQTLYVCAKILENGAPQFYLHALDLFTGKPKLPRVKISGSVSGTGEDNAGGIVTFTPYKHNQRAALTLANGRIYVAFASHEDYNPYHGWVFVYEAATLNQAALHCNTPDGGYGGIWMSGEGLNVDTAGNLYYINGNGTYDGIRNFGLSVVKLSPNARVLDWFTPSNYAALNDIDFDLGSSGGLLLPNTNLLVCGGKEGVIYVMDTANLGHLHSGGDLVKQRFAASPGHLHSSLAHWNSPEGPTLYAWGESDTLKAFRWNTDHFSTTPVSTSTMPVADGYANGPGLAVSANGSTAGTGIVWASLPFFGDATEQHVPGILRAFDAQNVSHELWNSRQNLLRDDLGVYAKFCPPLVANGRVYLATFTGRLMVYGLQPSTPPAAPTPEAIPGERAVRLRWDAVDRADLYTVKRSLTANGPFSVVAPSVFALEFVDRGLTDGTTYFYQVTANNSFGAGFPSAIVSARPAFSAHGTSLNVNFVGRGLPLGRTEAAGLLPSAGWNNAETGTGSVLSLPDNGGHPTDLRLDWTSHDGFQMGLADSPGDARMMNGYLDTTDNSTTTVTLSNVPAWLTHGGCRVIVYCDGDGFNRSGVYTLNGVSVTAGDDGTFAGAYRNAANGAGNYLVFNNVTSTNLTLTASPTPNGLRAPINGIQLTLAPAALSGAVTLQGAFNQSQPITLTFQPADNSAAISRTVVLNANGGFTLPEMPRTSGLLRIKGRKWLAKIVPLDLSSGTAVLPPGMLLLTGDVVETNSVDVDDLTALLNIYNSTRGDGFYDENADLNGNGTVDVDDLVLLLNNYNVSGSDWAKRQR